MKTLKFMGHSDDTFGEYGTTMDDIDNAGSGDHSIIYQTEPDIEKKVVYTDTLGQYTGLTDKNGVKIFEGDIVEYEGKRYSINYLPHYARFSAVKPNTVFCVFAYQRGEVIGNIYDTPELIGGEQNG